MVVQAAAVDPASAPGVELITQARTIWSVTPPIFAASVRVAHSVKPPPEQKAARPEPVLRSPRDDLNICASKSAGREWAWEPPSLRHLIRTQQIGIPNRVRLQRFGISPFVT